MTPQERILSLSIPEPNTGCWLWIGATKGKSQLKQYGHLIIGSRTDGTRKTTSAHRYSYEVFNGAIPEGMCVCHKCDTPSCVNPNHLFLGTKKDNAHDRELKNRNRPPFGERHSKAKLSEETVKRILSMSASGIRRGQIIKDTGASLSAVKNILSRRSWKHIPQAPTALLGATGATAPEVER